MINDQDCYCSVGAIEPQFYNIFLDKLGVSDDDLPQFDNFDELKVKLGEIFSKKTQAEWSEIFDETDACVAPVLDKEEAADHYHNKARGSFLASGMPRPAPLLSRTPATASESSDVLEWGLHTTEILSEEGFSQEQIDQLLEQRIAQQAETTLKL